MKTNLLSLLALSLYVALLTLASLWPEPSSSGARQYAIIFPDDMPEQTAIHALAETDMRLIKVDMKRNFFVVSSANQDFPNQIRRKGALPVAWSMENSLCGSTTSYNVAARE